MNILAIDTTTKKANVGLKINDNITLNSIDNEITHSEKLLPLIDKTIKTSNSNLKDIECIACTTGPGSFTGIRIGLATAKALAKVIHSKLFAMDSLELLAYSGLKKAMSKAQIIISLIDAKNTRAYCRIYANKDNILVPISEATNKYVNEIMKDVASKYSQQDILYILDSENLVNLIESNNYIITSLDIECLINKANNSTVFEDYLTLDATYVRNSEAERTKYGE